VAINGPEYVDGPATATAWSGGTSAAWGTYANVIDTSETTFSTVTLAATNTDYQNFFNFAAADWSDLPANAVITGMSVTVRSTIGTTGRVQHHVALATANGTLLAGASELNLATNTVATTTLGVSTDTEKTVSAFGAFPTRAQLISGTFGVRLRQRRSNTSVINIYSIKATVTYEVPVNTDYHVSFPTPTSELIAGAGLQEFRQAIYVDGAGAPTGELRLYENGTQIGPALWSGTVTGTIADPTEVSATWDATGRTASQIEARFVGTGVLGGTARLHSIEWNAVMLAAATATRTAQIGYAVSSLAGKSAAASFHVYNYATQNRSFVHNVYSLTSQARALLYNVLALASGTRALRYDAFALAAQVRQLRFDVYERSTKNATISYNISTLAGRPGVLSFNLAGLTGRSAPALFDTYALASKGAQIRYDIYVRAGAPREVLYEVRALASSLRALRYDVLANAILASKSADLSYAVRALAQGQGEALYDLYAHVSKNGQLRYDIAGLAGLNRNVLYNTCGLSTTSGQVLYALRGLSGDARTLLYNVLSTALLASKSADILYDVAALTMLASRLAELRYDIYGRTLHLGEVRYDLYGRAALASQLMYAVRAHVSRSGEIRYHVSALAGSAGTSLFDVYVLAGAPRTLLYDVAGPVGKQGIILYRVEQLGADLIFLVEGGVLPALEMDSRVRGALAFQRDTYRANEFASEVSSATGLDRRIVVPTLVKGDVMPD
jgi:hypothetical protein